VSSKTMLSAIDTHLRMPCSSSIVHRLYARSWKKGIARSLAKNRAYIRTHLCPPGAEGAAEPGDLGDGAGVEAVEHLPRDLAGFRRGSVVDGAELLVALPGQVHLILWVAGVEAAAELGLLALGEVFDAVAEQPANP